ncbi:MAG: RHS repeat-associated core domain-containing protein, partial [Candidatus Acidiferrales bacterium]
LRWGCEECSEKTAVGSGVTFKYDPFGRRIEKISPTTTSIFAYDDDSLIETLNSSGGVVARYTQGQNIDEPLATQRGTTTSYYEPDGLGSITSLSSSTGTLAQSYTYDSFGNTTNSSGSLTNFFRSVAREFDAETNLYYYRARYYDPSTGRFLNEDPLRFDGGEDFYEYVANAPTVLTDPAGLDPEDGPLHQPAGVEISCYVDDDCSTLSWKIDWFKRIIASHSAWDAVNKTNRHQGEIGDFLNGLANCITIHRIKCTNKGPCQAPEPDPAPAPDTDPSPVRVPAPSPRPWVRRLP